MTTLAVASSEADAQALRAVEDHHASLAGELRARVGALSAAAESRQGELEAGGRLVDFCRTSLLTHAAAEEQTMYPAARADERARLLIDAMIAEHRRLEALVDEVTTGGALKGAAAGYALLVLFEEHLTKENELVLPLLAEDPSVSLADLLHGMHELLGPSEHDHGHHDHGHHEHGHNDHVHEPHGEAAHAQSHSCGCGCEAADEAPELDVRTVPHAIRHATVFGALNAVPPKGSLLLIAPHNPVPLLNQIEAAQPGVFSVTYEEPGPVDWRLRLTRTG